MEPDGSTSREPNEFLTDYSDYLAPHLKKRLEASDYLALDLKKRLETIARSPEFHNFEKTAEQLSAQVSGSVASQFNGARDTYLFQRQDLLERQRSDKRRMWMRLPPVVLVGILLSAVLLLAAGDWIFDFNFVSNFDWLTEWWQRTILVVALLWSILMVILFAYILYDTSDDSQSFQLSDLDHRWRERSEKFISEAYRRAINKVFGEEANLPFPTSAPDLVELASVGLAGSEDAQIVMSETFEYVKSFIENHTTSAIGVAGPRGSGKSTLMLSVKSMQGTLAVEVLAASRYEPIDLLRRLAFKVAELGDPATSPRPGSMPAGGGARRDLRTKLMLALATASAGFLLIWLDWTDNAELTRFGFVSLVGLILTVGALMYMWRKMASARGQSRFFRHSQARELASALARDLTAERTAGDNRKVSLSLNSVLGAERSQSVTLKARELGYADVVDRLGQVLSRLGSEQREGGRVVVIIDELDKLPDVESLTNVINAIKDLLHTPRVHFLVSVSDEALASFELRGLQPRDAFDSSFDVIVEMARLTPDESVEFLESRIAAFPAPLARFCAVWAGGLPRDLIRAARGCIEVHTRYPKLQDWETIGHEFLARDLRRRLNTTLTSMAIDERKQTSSAPLSGSTASTGSAEGDGNLGNSVHTAAAAMVLDGWLADQGLHTEDALDCFSPTGTAIDLVVAFAACSIRALELVADSAGQTEHDLAALTGVVAALPNGALGVQRAFHAVRQTF